MCPSHRECHYTSRPLTESYSNTFSQCSNTLYPWSSPDFTIPAIHSTLCLKSFCFSASLRDSLCKRVQQSLRVAQLVERETVRVALYLEVACSTQALEIPFFFPAAQSFILLIFPRTVGSVLGSCQAVLRAESPFKNLLQLHSLSIAERALQGR